MEANTRGDDRRQSKALAALHATPALREVSQRLLLRLLTLGEARRLADHEQLCREGEPADAFFIVLDGRLVVRRDGDYIAPIQPGGSFGVEAMLGGNKFPGTLSAMGPTQVMRFPREGVLQLLDDSAAFRQALKPLTEVYLDELDTAEVVQLRSLIPGAPLSDLTILLARQITMDFGDRVLVLRPGESETTPTPGVGGVYFAKSPPAAIRTQTPFFDYVFLDGFGEDLPAIEGRGDFTAVTLVRGTPPLPTGRFPTRLYTVVVDERSPRGKADIDGFHADGPPPPHRHAPCWVQLRLDALRGEPFGRRDVHAGIVGRIFLARKSSGVMAGAKQHGAALRHGRARLRHRGLQIVGRDLPPRAGVRRRRCQPISRVTFLRLPSRMGIGRTRTVSWPEGSG